MQLMMTLAKTFCVTATVVAVSVMSVFAGEENLIEPLRPAARQAIGEFDKIDSKRIATLKEAAAFIRKRMVAVGSASSARASR